MIGGGPSWSLFAERFGEMIYVPAVDSFAGIIQDPDFVRHRLRQLRLHRDPVATDVVIVAEQRKCRVLHVIGAESVRPRILLENFIASDEQLRFHSCLPAADPRL